MTDREKVIKGLRICIDKVPGEYTCDKCPYETHGNECEIDLSEDALALLKEQPEIIRCKDCVKRETSACPCSSTGDPHLDWVPDDDWFCADGERRTE